MSNVTLDDLVYVEAQMIRAMVHHTFCWYPFDNKCSSCRRTLSDHPTIKKTFRDELITGCPYCSKSFVE